MHKMAIRFIFIVCLVPMLMGFCILPQGIQGHVLLEKNATMPLKGIAMQKGLPISTMVYVYEASNVDQLIAQEGHYAKGYQDGIYIPFFSGNTGVAFTEVSKHQFQEIDLRIIASSTD